MADMEKALSTAMEEALATAMTTPTPPTTASASMLASAAPSREPIVPLKKPASVPASLAEQSQQLERVERELVSRIRREVIEAKCVVERKVTDANIDFHRRVSDETARLEGERDRYIQEAQDEFHARLHDLERLLRRRPAGGF